MCCFLFRSDGPERWAPTELLMSSTKLYRCRSWILIYVHILDILLILSGFQSFFCIMMRSSAFRVKPSSTFAGRMSRGLATSAAEPAFVTERNAVKHHAHETSYVVRLVGHDKLTALVIFGERYLSMSAYQHFWLQESMLITFTRRIRNIWLTQLPMMVTTTLIHQSTHIRIFGSVIS